MLIKIPGVLSKSQVIECREMLASTNWVDGQRTAGHLAKDCKQNLQLPQNDPVGLEIGNFIVARLADNPLFTAAALPNIIFPPMFNCYQQGGTFGSHVDNAIRTFGNSANVQGHKIRTDISVTLFLSEPESYQGGELVIEDTYGEQRVKLAAGDMVIYPSTSLHQVTPVTEGQRLASFFWIQSLIRQDDQRRILFDLDKSIQALRAADPQQPELIRLAGVYHNLLRQWSEV
ncbi:Fe2+-dependent dioxygenase [Pseudoalteromonas tunicata]|uniref:Putative hydroxylase n=1 Tax=Pseudoalteromonas tunicata D2 TaxID=87626 RepID=A4CDZ4_9GAMM|nr:Fe2+-dependent dioxygenase [Pseudoalteromonas tunicata]ATC96321.1 PKHD-type hydroxylase [Pseudoalteromonas tunicata]AXT31827.1 Fe2+-dependent dioxygenase [Pseudoalteromonas tunicata]EAR27186.1 putative hydroxylase [Pseudoalteromonas tunicata D2]MDP4984192.1 Fe2+-dependent dioxygenase [Pseudoalteromonas tunicata]MDP5212234.1 Fe2+-dependent dioxygenase [Pseudoalteromonas tunicata]